MQVREARVEHAGVLELPGPRGVVVDVAQEQRGLLGRVHVGEGGRAEALAVAVHLLPERFFSLTLKFIDTVKCAFKHYSHYEQRLKSPFTVLPEPFCLG